MLVASYPRQLRRPLFIASAICPGTGRRDAKLARPRGLKGSSAPVALACRGHSLPLHSGRPAYS